jgi:hypothetical protein
LLSSQIGRPPGPCQSGIQRLRATGTKSARAHRLPACRLQQCSTDAQALRPRSLPLPTQNISSYTHHIKSFDACMEH